MRYCKLLVPALVALLAGAWAPALGQSDRGAITGTVKDPKGGVVPDAKVTATNLESSEVRQAKTTGEGTYILPELKAAPYRLRVEATGFKTATIDKIQVGVQITRHADVTLELGSINESVTVSSDAPVLQTDSPVQQLNVTERQVRELPLVVSAESGGRSPLAFIFLDSSVTPNGATSNGTNATNFRINGSQGLGQDILIDGAGRAGARIVRSSQKSRPDRTRSRSSRSTPATTPRSLATLRAASSTLRSNQAATTSTAKAICFSSTKR